MAEQEAWIDLEVGHFDSLVVLSSALEARCSSAERNPHSVPQVLQQSPEERRGIEAEELVASVAEHCVSALAPLAFALPRRRASLPCHPSCTRTEQKLACSSNIGHSYWQ